MTTIDFVSLGAAFLLATLLAAAAIPFVIRASQRWKLLDKPDARKAHRVPTPTLGGIGIFLGLVITVIVFGHATAPLSLAIVVGGCTLLFLTGIYDDLRDLSPSRKLLWQLVAALAVAASGARITSDFGLFGIGTLPLVVQYGLTVLVLTGVTNAVNLMDGIDGLAGGVGGITALVWAICFAGVGQAFEATLAICLAGALLGFLFYNFNPAKIFMGDTGSLVLGFVLGYLGLRWLEAGTALPNHNPLIYTASLLMLPVFDTLRVFAFRCLKRQSPFQPDRTHIHHILIKSGFNHRKASLLLYGANGLMIASGWWLAQSTLPVFTILLLQFGLAVLLSEMLTVLRYLRQRLQMRHYRSQVNAPTNHLLTRAKS